MLINGYEIDFPYKPYAPQIAVMGNILKALSAPHQHALIESPTGTGKSLALLCATLGWQKAFKLRAIDSYKQEMQRIANAIPISNDYSQQNGRNDDIESTQTPSQAAASNATDQKPLIESLLPVTTGSKQPEKTVAVQFLTTSGVRTAHLSPAQVKRQSKISLLLDKGFKDKAENEIQRLLHSLHAYNCSDTKGSWLPKIYYGTRTHSQIKQVIGELKKTSYRPKMCILGSREQYCIHPTVSTKPNKNEECKTLVEKGSCRFHKRATEVAESSELLPGNRLEIYDIEEFTGLAKEIGGCPYFAAREVYNEAEIVFCPYNYLLDPIIRHAMAINLENSVVLFDEAHNIEDTARDAASAKILLEDLTDTVENLKNLIDKNIQKEIHQKMATFLQCIVDYLEKITLTEKEYEKQFRTLESDEIMLFLSELGVNTDNVHQLKEVLEEIEQHATNPKSKKTDPLTLKGKHLKVMEAILTILDFLTQENRRFVSDYNLVLVNEVKRESGSGRRKNSRWEFSANFWCMNPAVAFHALKAQTHAIVLTSGTLSPMDSFSSELDIAFKYTLEASHVVDMSTQVYPRIISRGPSNAVMNASFEKSGNFAFQDSLGELVLKYAEAVAYGVLVFFPSYSLMDRLIERWKSTGLFDTIGNVKHISIEPKSNQDGEFDIQIQSFYKHIKDYEEEVAKGTKSEEDPPKKRKKAAKLTGSIFFAVCRGKVSEGIDFTDNRARCVIVVGIPFPNIKDLQINLKQKYNNEKSARREPGKAAVMHGRDWYHQQAFRALNQALGRCIRHRNDFGAILLVDERYNNTKNIASLSKWVRSSVKPATFETTLTEMKSFFEKLNEKPPNGYVPKSMRRADLSPLPSAPTAASSSSSMSSEASSSTSPVIELLTPSPKKSQAIEEIFDSPTKTPELKKKGTISDFFKRATKTPPARAQEEATATAAKNHAPVPPQSKPTTSSTLQCCHCDGPLFNPTSLSTTPLSKPYLLSLYNSIYHTSSSAASSSSASQPSHSPTVWIMPSTVASQFNISSKLPPSIQKEITNTSVPSTVEHILSLPPTQCDNTCYTQYAQEDGVVYELLWCTSCSERKATTSKTKPVGVKIVSANAQNVQLLDQMWIFDAAVRNQNPVIVATSDPFPVISQVKKEDATDSEEEEQTPPPAVVKLEEKSSSKLSKFFKHVKLEKESEEQDVPTQSYPASDFVTAASLLSSNSQDKKKSNLNKYALKFYVVTAGKNPGIYDNWKDCSNQIHKYEGAKYKSFTLLSQAQKYFKENATKLSSSESQRDESGHEEEPKAKRQKQSGAE